MHPHTTIFATVSADLRKKLRRRPSSSPETSKGRYDHNVVGASDPSSSSLILHPHTMGNWLTLVKTAPLNLQTMTLGDMAAAVRACVMSVPEQVGVS